MQLVFSTSSVGRLWVYSCLEQFLCAVFLVTHSGLLVFCMDLFISVVSQSSMEVIFLKTKTRIRYLGQGFPSFISFKCCLECVEVYFSLRAFFEHLQFCFDVVYPFGFFVIIFTFPYFALNLFASLASGCRYDFAHSPPTCCWNFISLFWKILIYLYCLVLSRYLFRLSSSASIFKSLFEFF